MTAEGTVAKPPSHVQPLTRLSLWALLLLAVANGLFLYLLPDQAATHYAWSIRPPINAAFMGAGYLAGVVAGGLAILAASRWRSFRTLTPGFFALGVVMLAATVLHADRFFWTYPPTWAWTAVYVLVPPAAAWLWWRQERTAGPPPPAAPGTMLVRWLAWPLGVLMVAIGIVLLVAPAAAAAVWPWPITPLLARAFAAWHLLIGGILVWGAASFRQPNELPIPLLTVAAWSALLLPLPLLYGDSLRSGSAAIWVWVALHALLLVVSAAMAARAVAALRAAGERL
ncbi:MAG TPA: hypothetical protein VIC57_07015 [Candidatus Dormibacteraeota bacterium]